MKLLLLVFFVVALFLGGCTTLMRPVIAQHEAEPEDANNVTVLRNYNYIGGGGRYWPTIDGEEVSGIFPKQHVSIKLPIGKHIIGVRCGWGEDQLEIEIKENEQRFFKVSPDLWFFVNPLACAEIEEISKSEAANRLKESTRIKTGYISDCNKKNVLYESSPDYVCFSYALGW